MPGGLNYSIITEGTNVGDPFNVQVVKGNPPRCTPGGESLGCSSREKCRNFMRERAMDSMDCVGITVNVKMGGAQHLVDV
tara:strand:- start:8918 stop:9157 length:240 start_codon:yes stop_codon:yes gene_type:complete